ncbi:MAG: LysR family transcriptional regulator [Sphingomonas sp.]|nr:MAG: LysR family transcriptional regulator [Sphingomonas sp.]
MALTLLGLRYFRAVADAGSVSAAAAMLDVAQSAISRQMQALEDDLGTTLLLRHRLGVSLTPAGEHLFERAADILRQTSDLRSSVAAMEARPRGELRIGFPPSLGHILIAPAVTAMATSFGDVAISLLEGFSQEIAERIAGEQLDFGITSARMEDPGLQFTPMFAEEIWLVGVPDRWTFGDEIRWQDVRTEPLIVTDIVHRMLLKWAGGCDRIVGPRIKTNSLAVLLPLLQAGMGSLVVPKSCFHAQLEDGVLVGAPFKGMRLTRYLAEPKDRCRSAAGRHFLDELDRGIRFQEDASTLLRID